MLWTNLLSFSPPPLAPLPHLMASEMIFEYFLQIEPLGCQGSQSNSTVWTKFICSVEDYSREICETFVIISAMATNQIQQFGQNSYCSEEEYIRHSKCIKSCDLEIKIKITLLSLFWWCIHARLTRFHLLGQALLFKSYGDLDMIKASKLY